MANMEHVQLVKRGRDAVARWRQEHPTERFDLNAAYMSYARIPQVDLSGADIRNSDLMGAVLHRANLSGCMLNPCHMYRANLVQADLSRALLNGANLRGANLTNANLSNVDLDRAILSEANLTGANLSGAKLARVNLTGANLTDANLSGANLNRANLTRTNLTRANLPGCDLYEASLNNVLFMGTKFAGAILGYTTFQNCDLGGAEALDQVRHDAPSTLGIDSLLRSGGRIPEPFLQGIGVTDAIVSLQRSLLGAPSLSGDHFISCLSSDLPFVQNLQADLRARGIRCWIFADNTRGNPLVDRKSTSDQEEVERWVRNYDKLVVVCSQAGLENETVRKDITEAQALQKSRDQWLLYLVAPDNTMIQPRSRVARELCDQHLVFDLRGRDSNPEVYSGELTRLADNLKLSQPAEAGAPVVKDEYSS
jgi:uncharacterized protein YjbI with pentapeptide repeats